MVGLVIIFGPFLIFKLLMFILENIFLLDCSSTSGGTFNFPTTFCGSITMLIFGLYYVWFVYPIPAVIPAIAIFAISKHFIDKNQLKNKL